MMRNRLLTASCLLLAAVGPAAALPAATPAEVAEFKTLETKLWEAWNERLRPADAAPFYSKDPRNIYFDLSPLKFTGWAEYERVATQALAGGGHAETKINDDFTVIKSGAIVITAFTFHADFMGSNKVKNGFDGRETDVWTKEHGKWMIIHQHMSTVMGPPAPPPSAATR
ncbi:MAG TPA: nuclear transport factor 2 family protein [Steroidobacteraceae bacterium]|nr:nuclear transport factor 2 family protein [Steroidobacteraceae bacterium]